MVKRYHRMQSNTLIHLTSMQRFSCSYLKQQTHDLQAKNLDFLHIHASAALQGGKELQKEKRREEKRREGKGREEKRREEKRREEKRREEKRREEKRREEKRLF